MFGIDSEFDFGVGCGSDFDMTFDIDSDFDCTLLEDEEDEEDEEEEDCRLNSCLTRLFVGIMLMIRSIIFFPIPLSTPGTGGKCFEFDMDVVTRCDFDFTFLDDEEKEDGEGKVTGRG